MRGSYNKPVTPMGPRASIVVPAHDEESQIGGLLDDLSRLGARGDISVVVVCNACTDGTATVARSREWAEVIEIADRGKTIALNVGDREAGDIFPRFYCDADIRLDDGTLERLIEALDVDEPRAVGPAVTFDYADANWVVRRFYDALAGAIIANWVDRHLVGRGLYGTNRAGRARFDEFPPVIADDLFFDAQFDREERVVVASANVSVPVPRTAADLLRREVRVAAGNYDLHRSRGSVDATPHLEVRATRLVDRAVTLAGWSRQLRVRDVPPLVVHLGVLGVGRSIFFLKRHRGRSLPWR